MLPEKESSLSFTLSFSVLLLCSYLCTAFQCTDPMVYAWSLKWGIYVRKLNGWGGRKKFKTVQIARLNWVLLTPCWHNLLLQKQQQESDTGVSVGEFQLMTVINEIYWLVLFFFFLSLTYHFKEHFKSNIKGDTKCLSNRSNKIKIKTLSLKHSLEFKWVFPYLWNIIVMVHIAKCVNITLHLYIIKLKDRNRLMQWAVLNIITTPKSSFMPHKTILIYSEVLVLWLFSVHLQFCVSYHIYLQIPVCWVPPAAFSPLHIFRTILFCFCL